MPRGRPPLPPELRKPKLSGAQRRKLQHEREEAAEAAKAQQATAANTVEPPPSDERWAKEFEEAGDIDLENPDTDLAYVRRLQLICLRQMATTAHPSKSQQDAWRRIREMSAVVGMTSNRAKLEADLRELKKKLAAYENKATALQTAPGHAVKRPPTARGRKRGPRPVPPDASGA